MRSIEPLFLAVAVVAFVACGRPSGQAVERERDPALAGQAEEVHWGYAGEIGPESWADLSPNFALCRSGTRQSPIDLTGATPIEGVAFQRQLGSTVLTIEQRAHVMDLIDNGHTIQITNDAPVHFDLDGERFDLVQYHFHAPSEHTIDGEHGPLEAHSVHKSAAGNLAVVGVLFEVGEHDPIWDPIINALPSGPGGRRHLEGLELDPAELHPLAERYFRYEGSLTTPPCSEGVHWIIMAERPHISQEQLAAFTSRLHNNHRPVQPRGARRLDFIAR